MSRLGLSSQQRAGLLLRCYSGPWRARYGAEFTELLIEDMTERPRSLSRSANVLATAVISRLRVLVPGAYALDPETEARAAIGALISATGLALALSAALWAQLGTAWSWSAPDGGATAGLVLLSVGLGFLAIWSVAGLALPMLHSLLLRPGGGLGPAQRWCACTVIAGSGLLVLGARHFANSWPGTGGPHGHGSVILPPGLAAFGWAATMWLSSYWSHPTALVHFPAAELMWMVLSPLALGAVLVAGRCLLVSASRSPAQLRSQARLSLLGPAGIFLVLAGAMSWVVGEGAGPRGLFQVGTLDDAATAGLGVAWVVAVLAAQGARRAGLAVGD